MRPVEAVLPRLILIGATTGIVVAVSLAVTALSFTPEQWPPFVVANLLIGLTYASIGAVAGVLLGRLGGTYFMLFLPMIDLGIVQTPMFGDGSPDGWATGTAWLRSWPGPRGRLVRTDLHAGAELLIGAVWAVAALTIVVAVLTRAIGGPSVVAARH